MAISFVSGFSNEKYGSSGNMFLMSVVLPDWRGPVIVTMEKYFKFSIIVFSNFLSIMCITLFYAILQFDCKIT